MELYETPRINCMILAYVFFSFAHRMDNGFFQGAFNVSLNPIHDFVTSTNMKQ